MHNNTYDFRSDASHFNIQFSELATINSAVVIMKYEMTERMSISMPDELAERINSQLSWGDNRSEMCRDLLREALDEREREDKSMRKDIDARGRVEQIEWATHPNKTETRVDALATAVDLIAERNEVSSLVIKRHVAREHDLELSESSRNRMLSDLLPSVRGVERKSNGRLYLYTDEMEK